MSDIDGETDGRADRQTQRHTNRQTDRQTDRRPHRQTDTHKQTNSNANTQTDAYNCCNLQPLPLTMLLLITLSCCRDLKNVAHTSKRLLKHAKARFTHLHMHCAVPMLLHGAVSCYTALKVVAPPPTPETRYMEFCTFTHTHILVVAPYQNSHH